MDLARVEDAEADSAAEALATYRDKRRRFAEALRVGFAEGNVAALVLLAEEIGKGEPADSRLAAELLADAARADAAPPAPLRHPAVAGILREVFGRLSPDALRRATLKAVDCPPDSRRGNRRLHWEAVLLDLYGARLGN